jgi:L-alanine-DL-glutamate epimerase-like enolase superfamily enzyme
VHRLSSLDPFAGVSLTGLRARPLSVPLLEPFVIATGRVEVTRTVEVEARVLWRGESATGLGEAACLPPVTREDQGDVLLELAEEFPTDLRALLAELGPVARAGVETAILDAMGRIEGMPVRALLAGESEGGNVDSLETDVTIAIADPARMAQLARAWTERGFRALKVKVGKDLDADVRALEAIGRAVPTAALRVDANAGYSAVEAIALARACERLAVRVECWEQPCGADDLDGMAEVSLALEAPVIADESVKDLEDVRVLAKLRYADGVNLKLAKSGGPLACHVMGRAARAAGLRLMVGGMVETRLGMTAAAHLACALGGVDFVDLDTAWLLAEDPYEGGYVAEGARYKLPYAPGLDVRRR